MAITTFDTLAYSEDMQKAGFTREQADAMARGNAAAFQDMVNTQQLATKQDIEEVKLELAGVKHNLELKIEETKHGLENQIKDVKHEILKWVIGMMIAQTTLILSAFGVGIAILK